MTAHLPPEQRLSAYLKTHAPIASAASAEVETLLMAEIKAMPLPAAKAKGKRWLWPVGSGLLLAAASASFYLLPQAGPAAVTKHTLQTVALDDEASVEAFADDNWQVLVAGADSERDLQQVMGNVTVFD